MVLHRTASRRMLAAAAACSVIAVLTTGARVTSAARRSVAAIAPASLEQSGEERLDPSLRRLAGTSGSEEIPVLVLSKRGARAPKHLTRPIELRLKADPSHTLFAGVVPADRLVKLATSDGVEYVEDNSSVEPPAIEERPYESEKAREARVDRAVAAMSALEDAGHGAVKAPERAPGTRGTPGASNYADTGESGHGSSGAWELGYTGEGVRVGVADTGVDFAHPELMGTHSVVEDTSSPYFGWPMAYDPFSLYMYRSDQVYGTNYLAIGMGWFTTSPTVVGSGTVTYGGLTYNVPPVGKSGEYHIGVLRDRNLRQYWSPTRTYPAVLVSDESTAGVYDTVRVDLDFDRDFADEKPCDRSSPVAYRDFWDDSAGAPGQDGFADISGGMVYWISDGVNQPPGYSIHFGSAPSTPAAGALVCFTGDMDLRQEHGTHCASAVGAQGRTDAPSYYGEYPAFDPGGPMVQGGGKDAEIVPVANVYNADSLSRYMAYDFAGVGLDGRPGTGDELQVLSCSFGMSDIEEDGWDHESRYIDAASIAASTTTFVMSTGNGGPGYGTITSPMPSTAVKVGASTQFGANGGWDSIVSSAQVTGGDVAPFSSRGPSAVGGTGVTLVANGLAASGGRPLNLSGGNGARAWDIWSGTSRSAPVVAGNLALVYQAFMETRRRWPTVAEARDILASGASDVGHDTLEQGSGELDAERSARIASGKGGVLVTPTAWRAGATAPGFAAVVKPGHRETLKLKVTNQSTARTRVRITSTVFRRSSLATSAATLDPASESAYDFNRPDALVDATSLVPSGTDLMVVRARLPYMQWNPTGAYAYTNRTNDVRLLVYDWTDVDGDGVLWTDADSDGLVDAGELDAGEYIRMNYAKAGGPTLEVRVRDPHSRVHDGLFIGLQHSRRYGGVAPRVDIEVSAWDLRPWSWISCTPAGTLGARRSMSRGMMLRVPRHAAPGLYEGQVRVNAGGRTTVVPVSVNVGLAGHTGAFGSPACPQPDALSPNDRLFGATDVSWRPESGDWRSFYAFGAPVPPGSVWLARASWSGTHPSDVDVMQFGQAPETWGMPWLFGPYTLERTGRSPNMNVAGSGAWQYRTATGGSEEWVAGPARQGLQMLSLHQVLADGASHEMTLSGEAGLVWTSPTGFDPVSSAVSGTLGVDVSTTLALPGLAVKAYGLSRPVVQELPMTQDGDWRTVLTLTDTGLFQVETSSTADVDLYIDRAEGMYWVERWASAKDGGAESIRLVLPDPVMYRVRVYGYDVPPEGATFTLTMTHLTGGGSLTSAVPLGPAMAAGETRSTTLSWTLEPGSEPAPGGADVLQGLVLVGPTALPNAVEIPVALRAP